MSDTSTRVVWAGRHPGSGSDVHGEELDGWTVAPSDLAARLDHATQLVVHDPLSFPWKVLGHGRRRVPLVAWLPVDVGVDDLTALLGDPLLRHVTAHDRLVEPRDDVRAALATAYRLADGVWCDAEDEVPAPDPTTAAAKAHVYEVLGLLRVSLAADPAAQPVVSLPGRAGHLAGPLTAASGLDVRAETVHPDPEKSDPFPSPDTVVCWLDDGGQPGAERRALLATAMARLHPGGRLVLVGYVVTAPGVDENPSLSTLVEELTDAAGTMLHLTELRSVQWPGEPWSRGVLLEATSLAGGRE